MPFFSLLFKSFFQHLDAIFILIFNWNKFIFCFFFHCFLIFVVFLLFINDLHLFQLKDYLMNISKILNFLVSHLIIKRFLFIFVFPPKHLVFMLNESLSLIVCSFLSSLVIFCLIPHFSLIISFIFLQELLVFFLFLKDDVVCLAHRSILWVLHLFKSRLWYFNHLG